MSITSLTSRLVFALVLIVSAYGALALQPDRAGGDLTGIETSADL